MYLLQQLHLHTYINQCRHHDKGEACLQIDSPGVCNLPLTCSCGGPTFLYFLRVCRWVRDTIKKKFLKGKTLTFPCFVIRILHGHSESEAKRRFLFSLCWALSLNAKWGLEPVLREVGNQSHETRILPSNIDHRGDIKPANLQQVRKLKISWTCPAGVVQWLNVTQEPRGCCFDSWWELMPKWQA